ncbi:O-methyltransferase family protein [C1] [Richelia intracellularis]|nr:O-methyltransferase family protein [C1] [Richelia intracellularis]
MIVQLSFDLTNLCHICLRFLYHNLPKQFGVAESGDDFTKFSTISQWFQTLIHPALMQRQQF